MEHLMAEGLRKTQIVVGGPSAKVSENAGSRPLKIENNGGELLASQNPSWG